MFIDSHFAEEIDLGNIADEAYFSKFHFIRLFKSIYGLTPHHYLSRVRIDRAQQLLKQDLSISEICFAVGFNSTTSFTGLFKKHTKLSPSEYQLRHRAREIEIKKSPLHFVPNCFAEVHGWSK